MTSYEYCRRDHDVGESRAARSGRGRRGWHQVDQFGLVVIDPVPAFTDPASVIGGRDPPARAVPVDRRDRRAAGLLRGRARVRRSGSTSLYGPGQFSGGDLGHPMAQLCTDASGADCAWEPQLVPPADAVVVTKISVDAGSCPAFVDATDALVGEVDAVLITGFWLSACVAATASSCAQRLGARLPVVLPLSLAGPASARTTPTTIPGRRRRHPSSNSLELVASWSATRRTGGGATSPPDRQQRTRGR
jgi:hypothetical protein